MIDKGNDGERQVAVCRLRIIQQKHTEEGESVVAGKAMMRLQWRIISPEHLIVS